MSKLKSYPKRFHRQEGGNITRKRQNLSWSLEGLVEHCGSEVGWRKD